MMQHSIHPPECRRGYLHDTITDGDIAGGNVPRRTDGWRPNKTGHGQEIAFKGVSLLFDGQYKSDAFPVLHGYDGQAYGMQSMPLRCSAIRREI